MSEKFLTVKEVAKLFRRHPKTVYRWIADKQLNAKKVMDGYLIPQTEIKRLLKPINR